MFRRYGPAVKTTAGLLRKLGLPQQRKSKCGNKGLHTDDGWFPSKKEHRRWEVLKLLAREGEIVGLRRQVRYKLRVNGVLVTTYVADFVYRESGLLVVEDTKGFRTYHYKIKRALMLALTGIRIRET